jgi:hypothetical protein
MAVQPEGVAIVGASGRTWPCWPSAARLLPEFGESPGSSPMRARRRAATVGWTDGRTEMRGAVLFAAVLSTALTMGLEFAHVLEWPQKQHYAGPLYVQLQESLYVWFGNLGGVLYVLAVIATVGLDMLVRRDPDRRAAIAAAAGLQVAGLVTFLTIVYPVNLRLPVGSSGAVPAGWTALRDRWELGHTIGFVLFALSFVLLLVPLVRRTGSRTGEHAGNALPVR